MTRLPFPCRISTLVLYHRPPTVLVMSAYGSDISSPESLVPECDHHVPTYVRVTSRPSVLSEANIVLRWWEDGQFPRFFSVVGITFSPSSQADHVQPPQHQYPTKLCVRTFITTVLQSRMYPLFLCSFWLNLHRETSPDPSLGSGRPQVRFVRFLFSIFVTVSPSFRLILLLYSLGIR
jgi:hypothetical protein